MKFNKKSRYFKFTLITLILTFITICIITLFIVWKTNKTTSIDTYNKAIKWQQKTKGIVSINSKIASTYKKHFSESIISENKIDTLILGSSTLIALKTNILKKDSIYNNAKTGNTLRNTISEAKFFLKMNNQIKNILIGYDWVIGKAFYKYKEIDYEKLYKEKKLSRYEQLTDAISYQRVKIIFFNIIDNLLYEELVYQCPKENNIGNDSFFEPSIPKLCAGYRYDGSSTFAHVTPVNKATYYSYLKGNNLKYYTSSILESKGIIEDQYLRDLKYINKILTNRGGNLYIVIPPLIPKVEEVILTPHKAKHYLKEILDKLTKFSKENKIKFLNFSKSEKFGCNYNEFIDGHHAYSECWEKILNTESVKKDLQGIKSDTF